MIWFLLFLGGAAAGCFGYAAVDNLQKKMDGNGAACIGALLFVFMFMLWIADNV